jgi:hypothetical protein
MVAAEVELKSPLSPFSKGEFTPCNSHPSLSKRGRGDFSDGMTRELHKANFWHSTPVQPAEKIFGADGI